MPQHHYITKTRNLIGPPPKNDPSASQYILVFKETKDNGKHVGHKNHNDDEDSWDNHDFNDAAGNPGWRDDE